MMLSLLVITCVFLHKVNFKLQKICVRSQKLCLTIPKKLSDNKLSIICTHSKGLVKPEDYGFFLSENHVIKEIFTFFLANIYYFE